VLPASGLRMKTDMTLLRTGFDTRLFMRSLQHMRGNK
jgi:hypothetical protein